MPEDDDRDDTDDDDDESENESDDDDTGNGDDDDTDSDDDDDDDESESGLSDADIKRVADAAGEAAKKAAEEVANRVADKRINQVLKRAKDGEKDGGKTADRDAGQDRYIRLVVREAAGELDVSDEQRKLVRQFAMEMVRQADLSQVEDDDEWAEGIVETAAKLVAEAQDVTTEQLRDSKKRRGGGEKKPGQSSKKPKGTSVNEALAQYEEGVKRAQKKYASEGAGSKE